MGASVCSANAAASSDVVSNVVNTNPFATRFARRRVGELTTRAVSGVKGGLTIVGNEGMYLITYCDMSIQRALARWRLVPPGVYAGLNGEEREVALRATRERYMGEEGERARVEMGLWIKAVNLGLFEDLVEMLGDEEWVEGRGEWDVGEGAKGKWFVMTEGLWGRLSKEDEAALESSRIRPLGRSLDLRRPSAAKPEPNPRSLPLSAWHIPGPGDVFVDQGRHVVTSGLSMRPVYWRYYGSGRPVRRSEWSMEAGLGSSGLVPFCDEAGKALEDAYRWLRYKGGGGSLTVQVREAGEDWMVQFRGGDRIVAVRKGVGGAVGFGKRR